MSAAHPHSASSSGPARESTAPIHVLLGPTAAGKTALSLELAERFDAELLSMDSMLVYRGLDVGTAKPSLDERARVPHHLIDRVDPPERFDVTRWLEEAEEALAEITRRKKRALFVGGTGFYLQALLFGLFDMPSFDQGLRDELQRRWREEGADVLVAELRRVDPELLERVHPNDEKRILRGLEVWHQTGKPMSELQAQWRSAAKSRPARLVGLAPEPDVLEERIATRTRAMFEAGWVEEARAVRDGIGFGPTSIQALGYREILRHVDGELDRQETEELIRLRTRQFARRQRTWFRRFENVVWQDPTNATSATLGAALGW